MPPFKAEQGGVILPWARTRNRRPTALLTTDIAQVCLLETEMIVSALLNWMWLYKHRVRPMVKLPCKYKAFLLRKERHECYRISITTKLVWKFINFKGNLVKALLSFSTLRFWWELKTLMDPNAKLPSWAVHRVGKRDPRGGLIGSILALTSPFSDILLVMVSNRLSEKKKKERKIAEYHVSKWNF